MSNLLTATAFRVSHYILFCILCGTRDASASFLSHFSNSFAAVSSTKIHRRWRRERRSWYAQLVFTWMTFYNGSFWLSVCLSVRVVRFSKCVCNVYVSLFAVQQHWQNAIIIHIDYRWMHCMHTHINRILVFFCSHRASYILLNLSRLRKENINRSWCARNCRFIRNRSTAIAFHQIQLVPRGQP